MTRVAERISFPSTTGPILAGLVDLPQGEVRGWGVFAHGFTLGKESPAASRICKQLASEGIGMLRFDNLGLGDSEGDWGDGSFSNKVADTVRAVEFMNSSGREVRLLVGHSFGGAAVIAAAHQCPTVEAVASIGAPYRTRPRRAQLRCPGPPDRGRRRGAVPHRWQGAHPQAPFHRGRPRRRSARADPHAAPGAARHAFAHRQHRRHRERE